MRARAFGVVLVARARSRGREARNAAYLHFRTLCIFGLCRFRPTPYTINPAGGLRTKVGTLTGADSSGVPLLAMSASRGVWCRG